MRTDISTTTTATTAFAALTAEIRKYPVFTLEQEVEKFEAFSKAEGSVRDELRREIANANLRFVLSIAKKYSRDGDMVSALVSVGTFGLYKAIDRFDLSLGYKFISSAIHWIRAEFSEYFRGDANFVRRTNNAKVGSKDAAIRERFLQTEQREPTEQEIIDALEEEYGITISDKYDIVNVRVNSMDAKVSEDDGEATLGEVGEVAMATASRNEFEREIDEEDNRYRVAKLLDGLSVREQEIVCRKFGIGFEREYELDEIADYLDCTHERVRQLLDGALVKLKGRARMLAKLAM